MTFEKKHRILKRLAASSHQLEMLQGELGQPESSMDTEAAKTIAELKNATDEIQNLIHRAYPFYVESFV